MGDFLGGPADGPRRGTGDWWVLVERFGDDVSTMETYRAATREGAEELALKAAREFLPRVMMRVRRRTILRDQGGGYLVQVEGAMAAQTFRVHVAEVVETVDGRGNPVT
ncbi:hypothetical protein [Actinokineospora sp. NBRC 105648]|uniref:hypothetical protein n=1 Tax=Actinokineospora sp. NBRC 105648 TaxID=3032206 RepID=UPI0024A1FEE7|nr:hypothetical protein [Actinokineospora sp. NBRC 105648]GLZ43218.1 hypothetical protein Acsp05_68420 [Actinokineospora sp. NBRC 105648]